MTMETILIKSTILLFLTIISILSGISLRRRGKPYKSGIFTIHKLAIASAVVLAVLIYIQHFKLLSFEGFGLVLFISSSLMFLISFVTGVALSFEKFSTFKIQITHRVLSWLTLMFIPVIWLICH
jgi:hypothetical protein